MYKTNLYHITIALFALIPLLSGCKKDKPKIHKQSFFSKIKDKNSHKASTPAEAVKAFDISEDSIKSFALDDKLPQHTSALPQRNSNQNKLLEWENLSAEESKNEFKRLTFEFNSYALQSDQQKELRHNIKHAKKMIKNGKTIVIEGHACHSAGSAIYNLALSEKRARHVAKSFAKSGIDAKHIKIAPRGHEMPIIKSGNREEQAINRRVEIFGIDT